MNTREKISRKPIIIAFLLIGFFTWLYDFVYDRIWDGAGWEPLDPRTALIYGIGASAAIAFTVAYVVNFRTRRLTKLFDNLEIVKIEGKEIVSPPTEKRFDTSTIVGYLSVPVTIAFASGLSIGYSDDPLIVISIFLGSIAIGLAIAIFALQQNQTGQIKEVLNKVNETNKEMHQVLHGKRRRIADLILIRIIDFEKVYNIIKKEQKKYEEKDQKFKEDAFDRVFRLIETTKNLEVKGCNEPVMYESFEEPIPSQYRDLLENVFSCILTEKSEGIEQAIKNLDIIWEQIQPLTKLLLKYSTPEKDYANAIEYYQTNKF